jgi:hypothetical protein
VESNAMMGANKKEKHFFFGLFGNCSLQCIGETKRKKGENYWID